MYCRDLKILGRWAVFRLVLQRDPGPRKSTYSPYSQEMWQNANVNGPPPS